MKNITGRQIFVGIVVFVVTAAVVAGFFIAGSPTTERSRRLDQQRVSDLQAISYAVDMYYNKNSNMPTDLNSLMGQQDVYLQSITDPATGVAYEYEVAAGEPTYNLCATFEIDSVDITDKSMPMPVGDFWKHGIGHTCFTLDVRKAPMIK